jgi:hypothetical protein
MGDQPADHYRIIDHEYPDPAPRRQLFSRPGRYHAACTLGSSTTAFIQCVFLSRPQGAVDRRGCAAPPVISDSEFGDKLLQLGRHLAERLGGFSKSVQLGVLAIKPPGVLASPCQALETCLILVMSVCSFTAEQR